MATGKTNRRFTVVKIDDSGGTARDVSTGVTDTGEVGLTYPEADVTGYSDGVQNLTLGTPEAPLDFTGVMDNTATTGLYTVLKGIVGDMSSTKTVEVQWGIRAAPTTGDPQLDGEMYCSKLTVNGDGQLSTRFVPGSSTAPAFGTV